MRNTFLKFAMAAFVLSSPLSATQVSAKVKDIKFHFVQGAYEDYPVYEMKFQNGNWQWTNKGKTFKPRMKLYSKHNNKHATGSYVALEGKNIWIVEKLPKKYEKLVSLNIGKSILQKKEAAARGACKNYGGSKKVVKDMGLVGKFTIHAGQQNGGASKSAVLTTKVVCHAKTQTSGAQSAGANAGGHSTFALKLKKLKLYTIPAKPACGKPVKLVAEFHTNRPGKVDFMLYRGDGEKQKASVTTSKGGTGSSKRWAKTYTFKQNTNRKYMVTALGHKASTQWVPMTVTCS